MGQIKKQKFKSFAQIDELTFSPIKFFPVKIIKRSRSVHLFIPKFTLRANIRNERILAIQSEAAFAQIKYKRIRTVQAFAIRIKEKKAPTGIEITNSCVFRPGATIFVDKRQTDNQYISALRYFSITLMNFPVFIYKVQKIKNRPHYQQKALNN
ncbi:hypothetical protein BpHYR1_031445 [Brachionus plicatilis]|uniref:Uncharacterized protein n=1 Tax=Brachionus plicatilis TaxID=10195 RepID=A0A3M7PY18_BRAPC|nr:hypothetical protein BpHYR1_031445 [Brachionus plicatilis]